jgi:RNA polymerase sigma-70 factor (ECF subfamily)
MDQTIRHNALLNMKKDRGIPPGELSEMPEEVLISRMRAGETQAYRYFFWEYCDFINLLTHSLLENREDARSVMLEIMGDVWVHRNNPRLKAPIKSFLYQEVFRKCQPYLGYVPKERSLLERLFRF